MLVIATIFIFSAIISFRYVSFGICFLLLTKCIIAIPIEYCGISIGIGTISGPDIVMIAIFLRVFFEYTSKKNKYVDVFPVVLLFIFIVISATYAYIFDHGLLVAFNRTAVGIASYYAIILAMYLLTDREKKFIINFALCVAFIAIIWQSYLIYTKNIKLLIVLNQYYQDKDMAEVLGNSISKGIMPRVFSSGILLIAMCSSYTLIKCIASLYMRNVLLYGAFYLIITFYLFSTGTRGFVFISALILLYSIYLVWGVINLKNKILLIPVILIGIGIFYLFVINTGIFNPLFERFSTWQNKGYYDAGLEGRFQQSKKAVNIILESPFGIGVVRPLSLGKGIRAGMWDVHGILTVGFLGGLPAIVCLFWFLWRLYKKFLKNSASVEILACGTALLYALILTMLNFTPAFSSGENILAFSVFAGYVLSKDTVINSVDIYKNSYDITTTSLN